MSIIKNEKKPFFIFRRHLDRSLVCLCLCILLFPFYAFDKKLDIRVSGVEPDLKKNILSHLNNSKLFSKEKVDNHLIVNKIKSALRAQGYYFADVIITHQSSQGSAGTLIVNITQNAPIIIKNTEVIIEGEALYDSAFYECLTQHLPLPGTILAHDQFDNFYRALSGLALERGYFNGHFSEVALKVSLEQKEAVWVIHFNSGKRYHFGSVIYIGSQIKEPFLLNLLTFKKDDPYEASLLSAYYRRLAATRWFESILLIPERSSNAGAYEITPVVQVTPKHKNYIGIGAGYSGNLGINAQIKWMRPWVNASGHSCNGVLAGNWAATNRLSSQNRLASYSAKFNYKIPVSTQVLQNFYTGQVILQSEQQKNRQTKFIQLDIARHWGNRVYWNPQLHVLLRYDSFREISLTDNGYSIYPKIIFSKLSAEATYPFRIGYHVQCSLALSSKALCSRLNFAIGDIKILWIKALFKQDRLLMRARIGQIISNEFKRLSPELRFFAGGEKSVRGYHYKSLGPRNSNGDVVGGKQLFTCSFEYEKRVTDRLALAAFIDTGQASDRLSWQSYSHALGLGIRWMSPLGPIGLDIAWPISSNQHQYNRYMFSLQIGPEW